MTQLSHNEVMQKSQRTRLKRRIACYIGRHWTDMLTTDFKSIFTKVQIELELREYDLSEIINNASDEQIHCMNYKLDEFQLSKKEGW